MKLIFVELQTKLQLVLVLAKPAQLTHSQLLMESTVSPFRDQLINLYVTTENKFLLTVETVSNVQFTPEPKMTTSSVLLILAVMMKSLPSTVHVQDVQVLLNQTQQKDNAFVS